MQPDPLNWSEILVCPKCQGELILKKEADYLVCNHCKLAFPVIDDIPVMLLEDAEAIND